MKPMRSVVVVVLLLAPATLTAQIDGTTGHTLAGAGLGAYSGATLGLLGGLFPCNRRPDGRRCVVSAASVGGALGLAMGGMIGSQNIDALQNRFEGAGIGVGVGSLVGLALRQTVHQYGWLDVGAMGLVGGAVGASPHGAMLGTGAGAVVGSVVWAVVPGAGVQELVLFSLAGMAVGGMFDWTDGASDRLREGYTISFSVGM